jgi:hypothetical protein
LSQTGVIPTDAWKLSSYVNRSPFATPAEAYIDDHLLGGLGGLLDVSAFAGREVKLEFVFPGGPSHYYGFDLYGFTPIREPRTWLLLGMGGGMLAASLWRRRKR